jgi:uncharacterized protein YecE (DUF72 family)
MTVMIGTSGWQYDDWRGRLYPAETPKRSWLEYYAARFATVESNSSFYRLPERDTFAGWADRTPSDFVVAVKASRYLTHVRRLREPGQAVARLVERLEGLGDKLGPVLVQLPPTLRYDHDLLASLLTAVPRSISVALEPRHQSWFVDDARRLLERHDVALCLSDTLGRHPPLWRTAGWGYLRFHAGRATPAPCYGRRALSSWAQRVASLWTKDDGVFCYFNNYRHACAVENARQFGTAVAGQGLVPTRTPTGRQVAVPRR